MKLLAIRSKIMETKCDIICLQEIKKKKILIKTSLESITHQPLIALNLSHLLVIRVAQLLSR
jgi:hypothetical protein